LTGRINIPPDSLGERLRKVDREKRERREREERERERERERD
jgi:hypothetical protein